MYLRLCELYPPNRLNARPFQGHSRRPALGDDTALMPRRWRSLKWSRLLYPQLGKLGMVSEQAERVNLRASQISGRSLGRPSTLPLTD